VKKMNVLVFTERFEKEFSKIKDSNLKKQVWNKILELENRAPIGKKLKNNPFWPIHINKYRVIYQIRGCEVIIVDILPRKFHYREL